MLDGCADLPAMDVSMRPHEEDKAYRIKQDEDYYEPGMVINDCNLHDIWYKEN